MGTIDIFTALRNRNIDSNILAIKENKSENGSNLADTMIAPTMANSFLKTETNKTVREIYSCYHRNRLDLNVELLEDIQLSKRQPTLNTTIFFVITTCLSDNLVEIRKR